MEEIKEKLVFDLRLATVVPGKITGENKAYELKGIDLAMKLHHLKGIYFFTNTNNNVVSTTTTSNGTSSFMSIDEIKNEAMYDWLVSYFMACGRIRACSAETGDRPSIKLNDAGIRIVEAQSSKTVDEWLAMENFMSLQDQLIYNHDIGPDLAFSPLVCLQVTWFKCGGISTGLSWAHILGDSFSASEFMNMWSQYMQVDESNMVEELVNREMSKFDFTIYGANLTFVDMEEVDVYGFEIKGNRPTFASYTIDGIEDKGAVLVLPGKNGDNGGKLIVLLLPENEIVSLKNELNKEWCIA